MVFALLAVLFGVIGLIDIYLWYTDGETQPPVTVVKKTAAPIPAPRTSVVQPIKGLAVANQPMKTKLTPFEARPPSEEERDVLAILWAIRDNEQTKDPNIFLYDSHNRSGASGIVQMTEGSLKSWSKQLLGREMTMKEYLRVDIQKEFSFMVIQAFFKRYHDPQIVCACWQSPKTDFNSTVSDGHWTVTKYVEECVKTLKHLRPKLVEDLPSKPWVNEGCKF